MKSGGKIINVGSGMGHEAHANAHPVQRLEGGAYRCSPDALALELWERGIEVNELVPGPVATKMVTWAADTSSEEAVLEELRDRPPPFSPSERVKSPAEVAEHVVWLASLETGRPDGPIVLPGAATVIKAMRRANRHPPLSSQAAARRPLENSVQ